MPVQLVDAHLPDRRSLDLILLTARACRCSWHRSTSATTTSATSGSCILQIGFWLTPIVYQDTSVPARWRWLLIYNPMARIISHGREAVVWGDLDGGQPCSARRSFFAGFVLVAGWLDFQRLQARLVEHY